jgi:hypothetical protein
MILFVYELLHSRCIAPQLADDDEIGKSRQHRDRLEGMLRIVRQVLGQRPIDGQGAGSAHRKVVAVRLCPRDRRGSNIAACAGLVLDDELVAQRRAHLVQDETGHVARASCQRRARPPVWDDQGTSVPILGSRER